MRLKMAVPDSQTGLFSFESVNLFLSTLVWSQLKDKYKGQVQIMT